MRKVALALCVAAVLAGCSPPAAPTATTAPAPQPSAALQAAFAECTWGEVRAAGAAIWSYACAQDRLVGDEALPGFQHEAGGQRFPVIRFFAIPAGASVEAALPAIRAASPGGEACVLQALSSEQLEPYRLLPMGEAQTRYQLMPAGEALRAYEAFIHGQAEGPSLPCGPLGPSEAGMRIIELLPGADDKVAVIETGSDIQIYDMSTLHAAQ